MLPSIIKDLDKKDIDAVLNTYDLSNLNWPTLFPLEYSPSMKWEQLEGDEGAPVAGDIISYDSKAPRKKRNVVSKLYGNIQKIGIAREKDESDINEYNDLIRQADTESKQAIVKWIFEDVEFVFEGVNNKLEVLALRAASTGKVILDTTNNDGIVTEAAVDFLVPAANKLGATVAITIANAATSKPITDIKRVVAAAKAKGKRLRYIYTDQSTVDSILASAETIAFAAPIFAQALNLTQPVSLLALNQVLRQSNLPIIGVIESMVTVEIRSKQTVIEPWEAGVMTFSETPTLGKTKYTKLAAEGLTTTPSIKSKRGHVLIERFGTSEPVTETTLGTANAFPVLNSTKSKWMLDATHTSWTH